MTLLEIFERLETTGLGGMVRDSTWLFPAIEAVHLIGLSLLGGSVLMLDLRLLGAGLRRRPVAEVARDVSPWFWSGLGLMFLTGIPLFLSEAVKCYYNPSFWVKMSALAIGILFAPTVRRAVAASQVELGRERRVVNGLVAATSLSVWFTVAAAGRWIGFS